MTFVSELCGHWADRQVKSFPYGNNQIHVQNESLSAREIPKDFCDACELIACTF